MHQQNAKAKSCANQTDLGKRLHPVVVGEHIIQRIGTEPVLAGKVGKCSDAGSHKRIALPLTESRFPDSRAVGFFPRFQNAKLCEVTGLIDLPHSAKAHYQRECDQSEHTASAAPSAEQEPAGAEDQKNSQCRPRPEQSAPALGEDSCAEEHRRAVE